jgi:ubiquinone/menaquinone biosynthesis C-methylase UbiE
VAAPADPESYYRDHWLEVEDERLEAYEQMFQWRPEMAPLLSGAGLAPGQVVVDYGCGPGMLAVELARRVGPEGRVHGVDLNEKFVLRARERAVREGVGAQVTIHHATDDRIPLADASSERVVCKNVLEYVPDLAATLGEFRRVLRPGGLAHAIDSDWGMLVVEPLGPERIGRLFAAASIAYRTPLIGRRLYGAMRSAGFREVKVQVLAAADTRGFLAPVVLHMAHYARASGRLDAHEIDSLQEDLRRALAAGTYLLVLPQFLVTGVA